MSRQSLGAITALFVSGAASLVLETLWFEWLALHWGRTTEASALVLGVFMLGLGVGQWLMARRATLPMSSAKLWALCELLVGLLAYIANWRFAHTDSVLGPSAAIFILLPTAFMGMTLPLAVATLRQTQLSTGLGVAYAANTAGATLGTLVTAWWLIPSIGLAATGLSAVAGQILAAMLIAIFCFKKSALPNKAANIEAAESHSHAVQNTNHTAATLFAVACSGFLILGMEVLWFRALLLSHRSTNENFAVMLAAVLLGLAIGSSLASAYLKNRPYKDFKTALAALLVLQSLVTALGLMLWQPGASNGSQLLLQSAWLISPACICSGALFVFAAAALKNQRQQRQASSQLILASTLGSAIAAPLVALWVLPQLGWAASVQGLFVIAFVAALFNDKAIALLGYAGVALLAMSLNTEWPHKQQRAAQVYLQLDNAELLSQADGKYQSVQLLQSNFLGEPLSHRLMTDSYSMTSTASDSKRYMRLFAWLPRAMQPDLENVLLISYGVGTTAETLLDNPNTQTLTVADPSATVLNSSRLIPRKAQPLDDPRVTVRLEDGRKVLQQSPAQFDLITGEPPPPRLAGMHALYSQEYFQLMQQALTPGGWASYWLPVDQLSLQSSKAVINAFCSAFADCSLWAGSHYNWILLGSRDGKPTQPAIEKLWAESADSLKDSGLEHPAQLASTFIAGPQTLAQWVDGTAALQDNWPQRIEPTWPSENTIQQYAAWMDDTDAELRYKQSPYSAIWKINGSEQQLAWSLQTLLNGQFQPDLQARLSLVGQLLALTTWQTPILWALGTDHQKVAIAQGQTGDVAKLHQAVGLLAQRRYKDAENLFRAIANDVDTRFPFSNDLAEIAARQQKQPD